MTPRLSPTSTCLLQPARHPQGHSAQPPLSDSALSDALLIRGVEPRTLSAGIAETDFQPGKYLASVLTPPIQPNAPGATSHKVMVQGNAGEGLTAARFYTEIIGRHSCAKSRFVALDDAQCRTIPADSKPTQAFSELLTRQLAFSEITSRMCAALTSSKEHTKNALNSSMIPSYASSAVVEAIRDGLYPHTGQIDAADLLAHTSALARLAPTGSDKQNALHIDAADLARQLATIRNRRKHTLAHLTVETVVTDSQNTFEKVYLMLDVKLGTLRQIAKHISDVVDSGAIDGVYVFCTTTPNERVKRIKGLRGFKNHEIVWTPDALLEMVEKRLTDRPLWMHVEPLLRRRLAANAQWTPQSFLFEAWNQLRHVVGSIRLPSVAGARLSSKHSRTPLPAGSIRHA
jgi:hypothetical protein